MTDDELKELVAGLAVTQDRVSRLIEDLAKEGAERQAETDRQLRTLRKEVGGLANKWGRYTEAMAYPSMDKLLREDFQMEFVAPDVTKRLNGRSLQIDVLGYSNTRTSAVYVVEVKSRLRSEDVDQILNILDSFFDFFPEHHGKALYGVLAAVHVEDSLRARVLKKGLYLAEVSGDLYELNVPEDFKPRSFAPA